MLGDERQPATSLRRDPGHAQTIGGCGQPSHPSRE